MEALIGADGVIICPSNPWVSIAPILALSGIQQQLIRADKAERKTHPVIVVSPIIGGRAIKGPAAKMYSELGIQPSAKAVANHYREVVTGIMIDETDARFEEDIQRLNLQVSIAQTVMRSTEDRRRLAKDVLNFVGICQQ